MIEPPVIIKIPPGSKNQVVFSFEKRTAGAAAAKAAVALVM
jgi:hypothetical protein